MNSIDVKSPQPTVASPRQEPDVKAFEALQISHTQAVIARQMIPGLATQISTPHYADRATPSVPRINAEF